MKQVSESIHPLMKMYSGFSPDASDDEVREFWADEFPQDIEKPCGVLLWCPYGPLVEQFPLPDQESQHFALTTPSPCMVFGHNCPAFYVAEPFVDLDALEDNCICDDCRAALESQRVELAETPAHTRMTGEKR